MKESYAAENKHKEDASLDAKKNKKELDKYKTNNIYSLKTYFTLLNQPELPDIINVVHEEPEVTKAMMEVIKRRKTRESDHAAQVKMLNAHISELSG